MFDMHNEINEFCDEHLSLGEDRRKQLADHRDSNLDRLKAGLVSLDFP